MQGPLGVASSARRVQPRPDAADVGSTLESRSANLDRTPSHPPAPPHPDKDNAQPDQAVISPVSSGTLFETSRLAAMLPADSAPPFIAAGTAPEPWQPPWSSFHLRDRSI